MPVPRRSPPEPLRTDDMPVVVVGTAVWVAALVVMAFRSDWLNDPDWTRWVWVCAVGVFLGGVGVRHVRRHQATVRDDAITAGQRSTHPG